jgi:hypothetical protein
VRVDLERGGRRRAKDKKSSQPFLEIKKNVVKICVKVREALLMICSRLFSSSLESAALRRMKMNGLNLRFLIREQRREAATIEQAGTNFFSFQGIKKQFYGINFFSCAITVTRSGIYGAQVMIYREFFLINQSVTFARGKFVFNQRNTCAKIRSTLEST